MFNFFILERNFYQFKIVVTIFGLKITFKHKKKKLSNRDKILIGKEYQRKYNQIIDNLKGKVRTQKLHVVFVVSEISKWNCQDLFDKMQQSTIFQPSILVTYARNLNSLDNYKKNIEIFKKRCHNVFSGYDVERDLDIDITNFEPDIVFFQQPWDLAENQDVETASKRALTFYIPYAIGDAPECIKYHLYDFYLKLYKYCVFSVEDARDIIKETKINNINIVGHPKLDTYYSYDKKDNKKKYVIYAPHHSINSNSILHYGTFLWNYKTILNFAKEHKEFTWIFKPHPQLEDILQQFHLLTDEQIESYFNEWKSFGIYCDTCDYFDYFKQSKCLITDCGSFLTEYLPTESPVIHLRNKMATNYTSTNKKIMKTYYDVWNNEQLLSTLDDVLVKDKDIKQGKRLNILTELGIKNTNVTQKIYNDIINTLGIVE